MEILIADTIDYKTKVISKVKERYLVMIKWSIQQEDVTFVNIYTTSVNVNIYTSTREHNFINIYSLSVEVPKYIMQMLTDIKGEIDSRIIIIGHFNTLLISMNGSYRQKINKETVVLNDTLEHMDLI